MSTVPYPAKQSGQPHALLIAVLLVGVCLLAVGAAYAARPAQNTSTPGVAFSPYLKALALCDGMARAQPPIAGGKMVTQWAFLTPPRSDENLVSLWAWNGSLGGTSAPMLAAYGLGPGIYFRVQDTLKVQPIGMGVMDFRYNCWVEQPVASGVESENLSVVRFGTY